MSLAMSFSMERWTCEACMEVDNPIAEPRCKVCGVWRTEELQLAHIAKEQALEAQLLAEALQIQEAREAEEAARAAALEEAERTTRDERIASMLGRIANRKLYDMLGRWIEFVFDARVRRQGEQMEQRDYRLGKRCTVCAVEQLRAIVQQRYVEGQAAGVGSALAEESLLFAWRTKPTTFEPLCGDSGVIVAVSAEHFAVELQFVAELHQDSGNVSAFWLPVEACRVMGAHELEPEPEPEPERQSAPGSPEPEIEPEPEPEREPEPEAGASSPRGRKEARRVSEDEETWEERARRIAFEERAAATRIQAAYRGHAVRRLWGPELDRTRGWTVADHLLESIDRLEHHSAGGFNLQFPMRGPGGPDSAVAAVQEEWNAAIGDGPHWTPQAMAYHISTALDKALGLALSGDTQYPDGIIRRRLSPEDVAQLLAAVRTEVQRRERLGFAGSQAVVAITTKGFQATDSADGKGVVAAAEEAGIASGQVGGRPEEGEYEDRHLEETVLQTVEDMIEQLEAQARRVAVKKAQATKERWSRVAEVSERIAKAAAARALLANASWFQPDSCRWLGSLTLDKLRLTDLGAGVLAGAAPESNLHTLALRESGLGSEGVLAVAAVLHRCPALTSLDLCGNAALNAGARAVAAAVTHPGCGLRSVAMTFNMTAREWSASGLEDCIRLLHSALPHSRLTSLRLDFRYEVISRTRPLRQLGHKQQKELAHHIADFGGRKVGSPLPEWLKVGASNAPKHQVTDEMKARLWANRRRASHAARQRLAWAVVTTRASMLDCLVSSVHELLQLAVAERTRRDASTTGLGGGVGDAPAPEGIAVAHHYIARRSVMAREGIETDSRPLRVLQEGEIVAGLEVKCDRRSGGEPRLRFVYTCPPMIGIQGWAPLSVSLPPGPTKKEAAAAAAAAAAEAEARRQMHVEMLEAEEERYKVEAAELQQAVETARGLPLGDEMLASLLAAEKAVLNAAKQHDERKELLTAAMAAPPPKPLAPPPAASHRNWQLGNEDEEGTGDSLALRRALNVEGDLLTPLPGCQPVPGDGRALARARRRRQRQLTCTTGLARAMVEFRNATAPEEGVVAEFLFVVAVDGRWPVHTSSRTQLLSYTEDAKVKFHSRLRIAEGTCPPPDLRPNDSDPVGYAVSKKRHEALFAEAPRWQRESTVAEVSRWLLEKSGLSWPASWACVRVADVMAVVEAEAELAQHRRHLELLKDRLPRLQETKLELEEQLARAAEVIDVVQHTHALASIEAKHYDGTRLDGTAGAPTRTVEQVQATEKLRGLEETDARARSARVETKLNENGAAIAALETEVLERTKRAEELQRDLASCAITDSVDLDWDRTLVECQANEPAPTVRELEALREERGLSDELPEHPEDLSRGGAGALGEGLSYRADKLDARLPALQRHTELLPIPISPHHIQRSPARSPSERRRRRRSASRSPARKTLAPLTDVNTTPVRRSPARRTAASPLFGR